MIGSRVVVAGRSWIGIGATVGDDSVIKGHVGDNARIGARCRIAGDLIHRQLDPSIPWDDPAAEEPAPVVEDGAFVGWRAVVVGGVNIGQGLCLRGRAGHEGRSGGAHSLRPQPDHASKRLARPAREVSLLREFAQPETVEAQVGALAPPARVRPSGRPGRSRPGRAAAWRPLAITGGP